MPSEPLDLEEAKGWCQRALDGWGFDAEVLRECAIAQTDGDPVELLEFADFACEKLPVFIAEIERLREAVEKIRVWSMNDHVLFRITMNQLHDMAAEALQIPIRAKDIREEQRKAYLAEIERNPLGDYIRRIANEPNYDV